MSTSKGYHAYIGGSLVRRKDKMIHVGDIMSTSGRMFSTPEEYQEYIEDTMSTSRNVQ